MGADGAANIIFAKDIKKADDPEEKRAEMIREYDDAMMNPYLAAEGYVDDVILPSQTRCRAIETLRTLRRDPADPEEQEDTAAREEAREQSAAVRKHLCA